MKTSSAKAKGRNLQKLVRDELLKTFTELTPDDIRSTSMGASGVDVLLSSQAKKKIPYSIECKSRSAIGIYSLFKQAVENTEKGTEPLLVVKQNNSKPLVVMALEQFLCLLSKQSEQKKEPSLSKES